MLGIYAACVVPYLAEGVRALGRRGLGFGGLLLADVTMV